MEDQQHEQESSEQNSPIIEEVTPIAIREGRVKKYKTAFKWMWRLYFLGIVLVIAIFTKLSYELPSFEYLENPRSRIASNVYAADGVLLGKYYIENRTPVEYDSLSPHLINALIATEDARYLNHSGIDAEALARVIVKTLLLGRRNQGGGSTISQQLAKLLVGRPNTKDKGTVEKTWLLVSTKLKEWLTAVRLERSYTKQEIIALYFNEFDFLYGANGIKSAAEVYFGKLPINLNIVESAMLVRMLKNPSSFNPRKFPDRAKLGREVVLSKMMEKGHFDKSKYDALRQLPIDLSKFRIKDHNDGIATYFREYLRDHLKKLMVQLAKDDPQYRKPDGAPYDIYRDGLNIYTTIDSRVQKHAEKAVRDHLKEHQIKLFATWKDWNHPNPTISSKIKNPWSRKAYKSTDGEMELRRLSLSRQIWGTDRYQRVRPKYMPLAEAYQLRDIDIDRIFQVIAYDKKPRRKTKYAPWVDGKALLKKWEKTGFISTKQAQSYKRVLSNKDSLQQLEKEYANIIDYMKKPVQTTVFAYNKRGEKDTLISPFDSIRYHRMHLQSGLLAVDPKSGFIRAWVGGISHKYFKFDHVNKRKFARQVGSTIKPFLYALTIHQKGYSPCLKVWDQPTTISKGEGQFGLLEDWTPRNAGGYSGEEITLTEALNRSLNSVSAYLIKELKGPEPFRNFLAEVGIDTSKGRVPVSAAICLGVPNLSPFEMTGGYTTFANLGTYTEPIFIDKIEDKNGNTIYLAGKDQDSEPVLNVQSAYVMNQMLQTIQRGRLKGVTAAYGGKTGTTNNQADGWFMGITPDLVIGTWVGCDDRFIRFRSLTYGQGASMARPIFRNILFSMQADTTLRDDAIFDPASLFPVPEIIETEMDCLKYNQLVEINTREEGNDATNTSVYDEDE